jgi:hypothetical protein
MAKYSCSGWHKQSVRHSNARKYGRAGGKYSNQYELTTTKNQLDMPYPLFAKNKTEAKAYAEKKLRKGEKIISIERSYKPNKTRRKKIMKEFEDMTEMAELRALSKTSLQRPLTDKEYERMMLLGKKQIGYDRTKKHYGKAEPSAPLKKESTELPIQFSINVPSTKNIDEPISPEEFQARIDETKKFLSKTFGGDTEIKGKGDYTKDGRLIQDDVSVIESSMKSEAYKENKKKLEEYIAKKQKEWTQDTIGYSFEDAFYIYPKFD